MKISAIIEQLRGNCPVFAGNVAGAAAYAEGVESQVWLPTPAVYVVPLEEDASENMDKVGLSLRQIITERVGVIIQLDNSADRRGQAAADQIDTYKSAIFSALLNWIVEPLRAPQGLFYGGGERLGFDRARFFYQFTFTQLAQYTYADGWQITGTPLVQINATVADATTGETLTKFAVPPSSN